MIPRFLFLLLSVFVLSGCATSPSIDGPSQKQLDGFPLIQDYQIPRASIPCTTNPVAEVDQMIKGVFIVATQRGHRVDGTHAKDDLLIFSKQGTVGPIVVGIFIFINPVTGQLVLEDIHHCMGPDLDAGLSYKDEVVRFISQGP